MTWDELIAFAQAGKEGRLEWVDSIGEDGIESVQEFYRAIVDGKNIRIAPDPIAEGHNPEKLTVKQIGEGYRCLSKEEFEAVEYESQQPDIEIQFHGKGVCIRLWNTQSKIDWNTYRKQSIGHNTAT